MKSGVISLIFLGLFFSLCADQQLTVAEQIRQTVQKQLAQFKKTTHCALGAQGCSQQEIDEARILLAGILGGLTLLTGGTVVALKKSRSRTQLQNLEEDIFPVSGKAEVNYRKIPQLFAMYLTTKNIAGIKNILAFEESGLTSKEVQDIKRAFRGDIAKSRQLYAAIADLAVHGNLHFGFEEGKSKSALDRELWDFFKSQRVTPADAKNNTFYIWSASSMEEESIGASSALTQPTRK